MNPIEQFNKEKEENIKVQGNNSDILHQAKDLFISMNKHKYSYNFTWMGASNYCLPTGYDCYVRNYLGSKTRFNY